MFHTNKIPNFLKFTQETRVNRNMFGKKMRVEYVLLIYFEQIDSFYTQIYSNSTYFVKTFNYSILNSPKYTERVIFSVNSWQFSPTSLVTLVTNFMSGLSLCSDIFAKEWVFFWSEYCCLINYIITSLWTNMRSMFFIQSPLCETSATFAPMIDGFPKFSRASIHGTWTLGRCRQLSASSLQSTLLFFQSPVHIIIFKSPGHFGIISIFSARLGL